jgi:hypothetical protein
MARLERPLIERIQTGATHRRPESSSFFSAVLRRVGTAEVGRPIFEPIPAHADEQLSLECLECFVDTLADSGHPDDIGGYLVNVVSTMARFRSSAAIVELGANCVASILPFAPDVSAEVLFECLAICSADDSTAHRLIDAVCAHTNPAAVRAAMTPLAALASGAMLHVVLARLEVVGGPSNRDLIDAFHPECRDPQRGGDVIDEYERSLNRLGDQAEMMDEFARIIAEKHDAGPAEYPLHLQVLFQSMCAASPAANQKRDRALP